MADKIECTRCHFRGEGDWFTRYGPKGVYYVKHRGICPMCLQEEKDGLKHQDRAIEKARKALYNHAKKYGMKPAQFAKKFGWVITQMAHDINHNFENWCPYCSAPYQSMGHGLADLTLDIINPQEPPYYTNVRYCCSTCNSIKGERGATAFGLHMRMVRERQEFLNSKPGTEGMPQHKMDLVLSQYVTRYQE